MKSKIEDELNSSLARHVAVTEKVKQREYFTEGLVTNANKDTIFNSSERKAGKTIIAAR